MSTAHKKFNNNSAKVKAKINLEKQDRKRDTSAYCKLRPESLVQKAE